MRNRKNAKQFLEELRSDHTELQAEYDRLGPRFAVISALVRARKRAGLTQAQLAERMGRSQSVIARLESAEHSPRLDTLLEAAQALDCRVDVKFVRKRAEARQFGSGAGAHD